MSDDSTYASAPFDHAKADIILRSSDNIDFRVFKLFLSLASPVFETLFDIPQPVRESNDQEVRGGLTVVSVPEDSKTLDALLRFCYPCTLADDPSLEELQDALDVLKAAEKYCLEAIVKKARQAIANPQMLEVEPLRCFAIAHRGRLHEETLLTAKYTLTQPLIPSWFQEIELISASDLLSLLTYHRKRGEAVYELSLDLSWIESHYGSAAACSWLSGQIYVRREQSRHHGSLYYEISTSEPVTSGYEDCPCANATTSKYALKFGHQSLKWWEDFMGETFTELREKPCKATVQAIADKTVQAVKARNCRACSPGITGGMSDLLDLFGRKIEETVSKVELVLNF